MSAGTGSRRAGYRAGGRMHKILIVEDEGMLALDLQEQLELEDDLRAVAVATVALAVEVLKEDVDFVLLDVNVLDGSTFGLARELVVRHIPFAFTSGNDPRQIPQDLKEMPF